MTKDERIAELEREQARARMALAAALAIEELYVVLFDGAEFDAAKVTLAGVVTRAREVMECARVSEAEERRAMFDARYAALERENGDFE